MSYMRDGKNAIDNSLIRSSSEEDRGMLDEITLEADCVIDSCDRQYSAKRLGPTDAGESSRNGPQYKSRWKCIAT